MKLVALNLFVTFLLLGVSAAAADHGNAYTSVFMATFASVFAFMAGAIVNDIHHEKISRTKSDSEVVHYNRVNLQKLKQSQKER